MRNLINTDQQFMDQVQAAIAKMVQSLGDQAKAFAASRGTIEIQPGVTPDQIAYQFITLIVDQGPEQIS